MVRINKYLSEAGFCSRREADKLIEQGRVTINGVTASAGTQVGDGDNVDVDGEKLHNTRRRIYIAFNKPVGVTCTTDPSDRDNIVDYISHRERIFNIGRLDKDSEGLIFLTNDGNIVNKILRAGNNHQKEYVVVVDKPLTGEFISRMSSGVRILGTVTEPCHLRREGDMRFRITLTQGLNRQIRRMCEVLGYKVTSLRRVRIMNITLDGIDVGKWRYFTPAEMDQINRLTDASTGTQEASPKKTPHRKPAIMRNVSSGEKSPFDRKKSDKTPADKKFSDRKPKDKKSPIAIKGKSKPLAIKGKSKPSENRNSAHSRSSETRAKKNTGR